MTKTLVSGTLRLANGQPPHVPCFQASGRAAAPDGEVTYQCTILGGHILVELSGSVLERDQPVDHIVDFVRDLIDALVLTEVAMHGVGMHSTIEYCRKYNGEVSLAGVDRSPHLAVVPADAKGILDLIGPMPRLRWALRDYNQGLVDRKDCPFFFYRAIETFAKVVTNKDDLSGEDWAEFHSKLGTQRADMTLLEDLSKKHRHGTRPDFSKDQHSTMLETVGRFVTSALKCLLAQGHVA